MEAARDLVSSSHLRIADLAVDVSAKSAEIQRGEIWWPAPSRLADLVRPILPTPDEYRKALGAVLSRFEVVPCRVMSQFLGGTVGDQEVIIERQKAFAVIRIDGEHVDRWMRGSAINVDVFRRAIFEAVGLLGVEVLMTEPARLARLRDIPGVTVHVNGLRIVGIDDGHECFLFHDMAADGLMMRMALYYFLTPEGFTQHPDTLRP